MTKYNVHLMPRTEEDIERNARWWAKHRDVNQAVTWYDHVCSQILSLDEFPESNALFPENDDFPYEIRDKLIGLGSRPTHRAVYTIRGDTVFVLAVRHGAQDDLRPSDVDM